LEREYQIVTTELTDDELPAVSGGYTLNNTMISGYAVAVGGGQCMIAADAVTADDAVAGRRSVASASLPLDDALQSNR
jgi:hypothetical protein